MPVKRRRSKRRTNPEAEAEGLACVFATGCDFFGDAEDVLGVVEPVHVLPLDARAEAKKAWVAAIKDAWRRCGRIYLDRDLGAGFLPHDEGRPWALVEFGEPETCQ